MLKRLDLTFQNPNDQIFKNKVLDEVMFGPLKIGQSTEVARENAKKMLELVGLSSKSEENPYDLSLAERKMISVASISGYGHTDISFRRTTMGQDALG